MRPNMSFGTLRAFFRPESVIRPLFAHLKVERSAHAIQRVDVSLS